MKDRYTENCKILVKETEYTNKWKDILRDFNIVQMLLLTKIIYRFNENPINIPIAIFIKREKTILKFVQNHKRQKKKIKGMLRKKTGLEVLHHM